MIIKLVIVAVIIYVIYFVLFKKPSMQKRAKGQKDIIDSETMLECKECGAYVSGDEAIIKDGKFYCSKECAKLP